MMDLDDLDPRTPTRKPKDLSAFSVTELEAYVAVLDAEKMRVLEQLDKQRAYRAGLDAFFKK